MKAFVTGGSGFVGHYLIPMLRERGYQVIALARSKRAAMQVTQLGAKAFPGDLNQQAMAQGMQGCDVVFHIAGFLSIWGDYQSFYETNVIGTEGALAAAQTANVPRFVQMGAAASVFGHQPLSEIDESAPLKQPKFSPYITTKSIAEQRVIAANRPGFKTSVVRPSWIWGNGDHVLPQLLASVKTGRFVWIDQGDYPYMTTHVANACHGAILAARSPGGQAYFLSDGDVVQFRQWITTLLSVAGVEPGRVSLPHWLAWHVAGLMETIWRVTRRKDTPPITRTMVRLIGQELTFSDRKAQTELGYSPIVTREAGLIELANAIKQNGLAQAG
ncbi:NAD-dependent epimerase/dehydratase family protein [Leptolyngbya sp. FACHB-261]|uniref:NAD-dependent epimerase/dehydratase family protein n=1 Tax=Leptolyngbya sp. FACHB-261 TaxID=2692806 RepID=UPI00168545EC|nr:NAD-dependent epimerase/dehydratase family protein [Leptolyngbya sp. FACHB-261]MBD2102835.1 NAD-dependent epimerase/dehydratase family protein [Leptolyngbya sp. FACHB-261]